MNRRGLLNEIWIVIILFIVMVVIMFAYTLASIAAPLVVGEGKAITSILSDSFSSEPNSSLANATAVSVQTANSFLGMIELSIYLLFFGALVGYIAVCYYVKTYKWLAMVWLMLIVAAVVISMVLSNAYQTTSQTSGDLASFYSVWGTNDFLMNYLPYIVAGFGILSGIVLFAIIAIGSDEETKEIN